MCYENGPACVAAAAAAAFNRQLCKLLLAVASARVYGFMGSKIWSIGEGKQVLRAST